MGSPDFGQVNLFGGTDDFRTASARACAALTRAGFPLSSVYLERDGRLRCHASHGYGHVFDGFERNGVIGKTFDTGQSQRVDPRTESMYLPSATGSVCEICVPIIVEGRTVGVVDVETNTEPPTDAVLIVERVAAELAAVIIDTSEDNSVDMWQRLADASLKLTDLTSIDDVIDVALDLLVHFEGAHSAVVHLPRVEGAHARTIGPLASTLEDPATIADTQAWLRLSRTCFALAEAPPSRAITPRFIGDEFAAATRLERPDGTDGFLLAVGGHCPTPTPQTSEQLDVLAALVSAAISRIESTAALVTAANVDPLTGLLHRRAFRRRLDRDPAPGQTVALYVIDIDNFKEINDRFGHEEGDRRLRVVAEAMTRASPCPDSLFRIGGDEFVVVAELDQPADAAIVAERLLAAARACDTPISIGIDINDTGRSLDAMFRDADAALLTVKQRGRNGWAAAAS